MPWASQGPRVLRAVGGLAVGVSVVAFGVKQLQSRSEEQETKQTAVARVYQPRPLNKVLASWTTNFEPYNEWDSNWDR